jgi:hypothetical protein
MAGLALGSWLGGRLSARGVGSRRGLVRYAAAEAAIGVLALAVPSGLRSGHALFAASGTTLAWDSAAYHLVSGVLVALTLLPCCTAMGATFPLAMAAIRTGHPDAGARAFSFLYLANVLGAALRHARVGVRQAMLTSSLKEERVGVASSTCDRCPSRCREHPLSPARISDLAAWQDRPEGSTPPHRRPSLKDSLRNTPVSFSRKSKDFTTSGTGVSLTMSCRRSTIAPWKRL